MKLATVVVLFATLLSGCIKETFPTTGATQEQVNKSPYALEALVSGMNAAMIAPGFAISGAMHCDFSYPAMMIMRDEMLDVMPWYGEPGWDWFARWGQGLSLTDNGYPASMVWNTYYPLIYSCNTIIKALKGGDQNLQYLGIAYSFRALYYLDLVRMYGYKTTPHLPTPTYEDAEGNVYSLEGLAVPIVDEDTTEEMAKQNPRATADEVYAFILEDLGYAAQCLATYTPASKAYPSLSVVYGLYARTYLELAVKDPDTYYPLAAEYARKAIDASGCTPLTQEQWEDPINGFNNMASQNSWMLGMTQSPENVSNLLSFTGFMSGEQDWGYSSIVVYDAYFKINPTLYNTIPNSDFRKHSWIDPAGLSFYNYKIAYFDPEAFWEANWEYAPLKFRCAGGETEDFKTGNATDIPMMRVEEMMLIEAEATAYTNLEAGKQLLTDFMAHRITNGTYVCSQFSSFETFQQEVIKQKKIEFWGEGILFFDYKRLGLGLNRLGADSIYQGEWRFDADQIAPAWNFVIPRSEIQNNSGIQANNPDPSGVLTPATASLGLSNIKK